MLSARHLLAAALFAGLSLGAAPEAPPPPVRYRVEQVFRLETTTARPQAEPATTAVEGRVRFLLEQRLEEGVPPRGAWRFIEVESDGPRTTPPEAKDART